MIFILTLSLVVSFFFNDTATTEIYTLSLHDALPISRGAWNNGDLNDRTGLGEYLAQRGYVMLTLNFRHAADGYPTTLADIHYGIRWTKANAKELKVNPDQVAIGGASSGGHLAMLVAMRPNDPRYAAIPGPAGVDSSVKGVIMLWPVINPISRYRNAIRRSAEPNPPAFSIGRA